MGGVEKPSRVFVSQYTGAGVHVISSDHCPPHGHARHRGDGWIARVSFSFLSSALKLLSIAPSGSVPLRRTLNLLLDNIEAELPACRRVWWTAKQTTCLAKQWAVIPAPGVVEILTDVATHARHIGAAIYDPLQQRLQVTFLDGTTLEASL